MTFREDLEPLVQLSEAAILRIASQRIPGIALKHIGPIETGSAATRSTSWSCWIVTSDDVDKEALQKDVTLIEELQRVATEVGFAPDSITVESQETVDRDFEGSWFYAMR